METYDYEIVVVGAGPAGLSAALNAARSKKRVLLIGPKMSYKLLKTPLIDNVLGLPAMSGKDLMEKFRSQVEEIKNVDFREDMVENIYSLGDSIGLLMPDQTIIKTISLVLATGVSFGRPIKGEEEFLGKGVSSCAVCDAALYKNKKVVIIAYSKRAEEEIAFMKNFASSIAVVNMTGQDPELGDDGEIELIEDRAVKIKGNDIAQSLVLASGREIEASGFFFIRDAKKADRLAPEIKMDAGHVLVTRNMETNMTGLFACGDLVGRPYQISKAIGEGQIAGLAAVNHVNEYLKSLK